MKLTLQDIKGITQGAVDVFESNEGIRFSRFNAAEFELYANNPRLKRLKGSAGIHLEFDTDAETFSMTVLTEEATNRRFYSFDIFSNNEIVGHIKNFEEKALIPQYDTAEGSLGENFEKFQLGNGNKRIKVVFPWSAIAIIKEITLEGATFVSPIKKEKLLLAYGDSITQGYDARYPSNSYAEKLAEALSAELFNKGVAGEFHYPELASVKSDFTPDLITVAYGTNDWSNLKRSDFEDRCKNFWKVLNTTYPGIKKFAITPIWRKESEDENFGFGNFFDVAAFIEETVSQYNDVILISGIDFVPKDIEYFSDLRLHPTDEGFMHYFENLHREILKHI